jgi:hypothetical protein
MYPVDPIRRQTARSVLEYASPLALSLPGFYAVELPIPISIPGTGRPSRGFIHLLAGTYKQIAPDGAA